MMVDSPQFTSWNQKVAFLLLIRMPDLLLNKQTLVEIETWATTDQVCHVGSSCGCLFFLWSTQPMFLSVKQGWLVLRHTFYHVQKGENLLSNFTWYPFSTAFAEVGAWALLYVDQDTIEFFVILTRTNVNHKSHVTFATCDQLWHASAMASIQRTINRSTATR